MGLIIGLMTCYRSSEYRLLGYSYNESECKAAGIEFKELRAPRGFEP